MPVGSVVQAAVSAPKAATAGAAMLRKGSSGPEVLALQQALASAGFNPHGFDGKFGPKTEAALLAFQRSKGIIVDGKAGPQTWGALRGTSPTATPTAAPANPAEPTLKIGSKGPQVLGLQKALLTAGFNPRGLDGSFGPKTEAALMAFQRSTGLPATGSTGADTWAALRIAAPEVPPLSGPAPGSGTGPKGALIPPNSKVLVVGDSHTRGQFGLSLESQLRGSGMTVSTYASGGRSAKHWVKGHVSAGAGFRIDTATPGAKSASGSGQHAFEPLEEIIRREKPAVLVMADGSNALGEGGGAAVARVKALAEQYGVKLIWVGPPEMRKFKTEESYYQALRANLGSSVPVIDSRAATKAAAAAGLGDGVHFSGNAAKEWALAVSRQLTGT